MSNNQGNNWNFQTYTHQTIGNTSYTYVSNTNSTNQQHHGVQQQQQQQTIYQPSIPPPPPPPPPSYQYNPNVSSMPPSYPINSTSTTTSSYATLQPQSTTMHQFYQPYNNNHYNSGISHVQYSHTPPPPPPPPTSLKPLSPSTHTKNNNYNHNHNSIKNSNNNNQQPCTTYKCEPCSITFDNNTSYQAHLSSHIQCSYPKCTFKASKKVISAHYSSIHGKYSGRGLKTITIQTPGSKKVQRFKICVGNHPEDVQAWIKERRKRFPTRERISKLEEKNHNNNNKNSNNKRMRDGSSTSNNNILSPSDNKKIRASTTNVEDDNNNDDKVSSQVKSLQNEESHNAFSNLADYGSSSDDDDDNDIMDNDNTSDEKNQNDQDDKHQHTQSSQQQQVDSTYNNINEMNNATSSAGNKDISKLKTKQCRYFLRNGTCKNGDKCTYIHDMNQHEIYKANASSRREVQSKRDKAKNEARREMNLLTTGRADGNGSGLPKTGQTLLRKLLQNDIRRERSLCLQLLRYIVDCNFLQENKDDKKESDDTS